MFKLIKLLLILALGLFVYWFATKATPEQRQATQDMANSFSEDIGQTIKDAGRDLKEKGSEVYDNRNELFDKVGETIKEVGSDLKQKGTEIYENRDEYLQEGKTYLDGAKTKILEAKEKLSPTDSN